MEVTLISQEHIKPSPPLPDHLKAFKLSLLDQYQPGIYSPIIFFYSHKVDPNHLKESLSETLANFYPLAGKIKDHLSLDCNEEGALFVETRVNCSLSELLSRPPDLLSLRKLLPCELVPEETDIGTLITNIQVNLFECGGAAIGLCVSHKIVDGGVLSDFMKSWSATARGEGPLVIPDFSAASVFSPSDTPVLDYSHGFSKLSSIKGNGITRRFLFDSSSITALKDQVRSLEMKYPSRMEVVSAFVLKRAMAASRNVNNGQPRSYVVRIPVNLRRRMKPPMPESLVGNIIWSAIAHCKEDDADKSLRCLTGEMRRSIQRLQSHFVEHLTGENMKDMFDKSRQELGEMLSRDETGTLAVTSWCRFGYYETDFGWGKPVWVSIVGNWFTNLVVLVDAGDGDGVEAWITLDETLMSVLAGDEEMGRYTRLDPSPLSPCNGDSAIV